MNRSPRVLVGTLYCGENEFDELEQSLKKQTYSHWEHFVYKNLPNKEAHDRLYRTFMEEQDSFDLFLKLDADMVFRSEEGLQQIVEVFNHNSNLDHLTLAVRDWYSDSLIEGLHIFSDRAGWSTEEESRFVDASPKIPGQRMALWSNPAPIVDHSPNPSPFQAFRFGVHRALKVIQQDRWVMVFPQIRRQWRLLESCWDHFINARDRRLGLVLLGAEEVLNRRVNEEEYDEEQSILETRLKKYIDLEARDIRKRLELEWQNPLHLRASLSRSIGVLRLLTSYIYHLGHLAKVRYE